MNYLFKPFQCPICNSPYCCKDNPRLHSPSKVPYVIPCKHSICESCLRNAIKNKVVICPICKSSFNVPDGEASLSDFHPDVHALGILSATVKRYVPSTVVKMVPTNELNRQLSEDSIFKSTSAMCGNCRQRHAQWQCDKCELNFCNTCFDEVHVKKLKRHEGKKLFAEMYNTMVQDGCPDHDNKGIEFYCEVDNKLTCSFCMLVGSHVGHKVMTLVDKNKSTAEGLKKVIGEVAEVEKRLKYTDQLLTGVIPSQKLDVSQIIKKVHDRFHELHALLQLREIQLLSELEDISQQNTKPIEKMRSEVSAYQKDLVAIKRDAEAVIENPFLAISAPALLKKLDEFKTLPCYLVNLPVDDEPPNIELTLESELENNIKEFGKVTCILKPKFALKTKDELPEDYSLDIPESALISECDSRSTTTIDSFSEDSLSIMPPSKKSSTGLQASLKCREFTRMQPEKVFTSYVQSPSSFWVQRCSEKRKLSILSEDINKWCRGKEARKQQVVEVNKGDLYLVQYSVDKKWYRARVKNIIKSEDNKTVGKNSPVKREDGTIIVKPRESMVEVTYIDYGNTEVIPVSKMQNIQARFLNLPGLSKECSLVDIVPANGTDWTPEALNVFISFVDKTPLIMQIYEERNNILYVDLSQVPDHGITSDAPVSVRDALVFMEHAGFPVGRMTTAKIGRSTRQFLPPEQLHVNSSIHAILSHVDSPSHFYIQQISTASYLSSLIFEMNDVYNNDHATMLNKIFAPHPGMICAAQFTLDQQWYRAQVKSLPGGAKVEVQYVDFGNSEVIHHKRLRKLFDKFMKLNIQAIPCMIADVAPIDGKNWTTEVVEWMTKNVSKKQLVVKSVGIIPGEKKINVVISYPDDEYDICVNALLVEQGFAKSCGPLSTVVKTLSQNSKKVQLTTPIVKSPVQKTEKPEPVPIEPPVPKETRPTLVKTYPDTDGKTMDVIVSHIYTPELFYIRIASELEKKLSELMDKMQKAYENFKCDMPDCIVGKSYVVFSGSLKKWCRANVVSKVDNEFYEVFLVDYGSTENVPKKNIVKLLEEFTEDESFSLRCHLSGIIPAGGSSQWSKVACETFQQLVAPHEKLLVTTNGVLENNSLGVELFYEQLVRGGALEPTKIEFISITKELIHRGLALKIRKIAIPAKAPASVPEVAKESKTLAKVLEEQNADKSPAKIQTDIVSKKQSDTESSELPLVETTNRVSLNHCENGDHCENDILIQDNDVINVNRTPTFQWKPRVVPTEPKFKGFVTNIGDDGSIHLHVVKNGSSQVDVIKKALQYKYCKPKHEVFNEPLPVGEACIAKFYVDSLWYRAEVMSHYPGKVKVNFVDYGNNEIVPLGDIRTDITMQSFPRQCIECKISGIPVECKGNNEVLNFLHVQLVDSIVDVEIIGSADDEGRLPCNITTLCGITVSDLLDNMDFGTSAPSQYEIIPKKAEVNLSCRTFKKATDLQEGDMYPVCITQINSPNIVYLQILKNPSPKSAQDDRLNREHEAFLRLIEDLQEEAESFPPVKEPYPGLACCAKYSYDNNWYRCEITNLGDNEVDVLYVDYGNSETIPIENLRDPRKQFIDFPVQVHFCEIHGMKDAENTSDINIKEILVEKLLTSGKEIFAKILIADQISKVELMAQDELGNFKSVCEDLIKQNLTSASKDQ